MLGASPNEIAFVAMLIAIVLIVPRAPKIGEKIGGFFGSSSDPVAKPARAEKDGSRSGESTDG